MATDQDTFQQKEVVAKNDAYTGMLAISLICLLVGCGLLYLDYQKYGEKAPSVQSVPKLDPNPAPPPNVAPAPKQAQKKAPPPVNKGGNPPQKKAP